MTAKIAAAALLIGAFGYALWLRVFRRPMPSAEGRQGWRRGFFWATVLFAAWLGTRPGPAPAEEEEEGVLIMCYSVELAAATTPEAKPALSATVRAAWLSLDGSRGEELRLALEKEVAARGLSADAARLLRIAFRQTAQHYYLARGEGAMSTCYDMGMDGVVIQETREHLLTRMEWLAEAGREGRIDAETHDRVAGEIAQALAAFGAADAAGLEDYRQTTPEAFAQQIQTVEAIQAKTVPVDAAAEEAAVVLAEWARSAPEGWAESPPEYRWGEKRGKGSDPSKPGVWQPPPPMPRDLDD